MTHYEFWFRDERGWPIVAQEWHRLRIFTKCGTMIQDIHKIEADINRPPIYVCLYRDNDAYCGYMKMDQIVRIEEYEAYERPKAYMPLSMRKY